MKSYLVTYTLLRDESGNIPADKRQVYSTMVQGDSMPNHATAYLAEELDCPLSYIGIMGIEEVDTQHDNTHAYTIEHEDFPEESRDNDFVAFALPAFKEDRRDIFAQYRKAVDFFSLACDVVTGLHHD
jgi:hypothetical protein